MISIKNAILRGIILAVLVNAPMWAATTFKDSPDTNNQTVTITLASLSSSITACRASTAIDNSTTKYLDIAVSGKFETGTVSGDKQVLIFAAGTVDGGTTYGGGNGANTISGTDAAFTRLDPTELPLLKAISTPTNSIVQTWGPIYLAQAFGGLPDHVVIVFCNDTGAALSATAGNNKVWYQGFWKQGV